MNSSHSCMPPKVFSKNNLENLKVTEFILNENTEGMIFVEGGEFEMGGDNNQAMQDEFPKHKVLVNSFWMDETEVTNNQFNDLLKLLDLLPQQKKQSIGTKLKRLFHQELQSLMIV